MGLMSGKKVLIAGIANDKSIAWGCAKALKEAGAELAITYLNAKAERYVRPLAEELDAPLILEMDVTVPGDIEKVFKACEEKWGKLDGVIHSMAYCPLEDLHAPLSDCTLQGFLDAMHVSCYSFIEMSRYAKGMMPDGGAMVTFSYLGSAIATGDYNVMGLCKAGVECATRYLARDLGPLGIRVNTISPGTIETRAAKGIKDFDAMIEHNRKFACDGELPTIEEVGNTTLYFMSDLSRGVTGQTHYVDHGVSISS